LKKSTIFWSLDPTFRYLEATLKNIAGTIRETTYRDSSLFSTCDIPSMAIGLYLFAASNIRCPQSNMFCPKKVLIIPNSIKTTTMHIFSLKLIYPLLSHIFPHIEYYNIIGLLPLTMSLINYRKHLNLAKQEWKTVPAISEQDDYSLPVHNNKHKRSG